ncbi:MAG TPA: hypothetical protein VEN81_07000 [Planctomycetota bacterium]|nr:hypothetical protein [Planctomycetota bacterium]
MMKMGAMLLGMGAALVAAWGRAPQDPDPRPYTDTFSIDPKELSSSGRNPYFILEPGYQMYYESADKKETLTVTVLEETRKIAGIETRIVEERETEGGKEKEVSRNYFAICKRTNNVYYFGEDAGGAWMHGEKGARFGLVMPGSPLLGARYYQEVAPGTAMDRAEIVSLSESLETPAGKFEKVLKILETTPLDAKEHAHKLYAPGVGKIFDANLTLVRYGKK